MKRLKKSTLHNKVLYDTEQKGRADLWDENGHFKKGHKGISPGAPKRIPNRELVDQWFREASSKDGIPRARQILEEIFARAMGDADRSRELREEYAELVGKRDKDSANRKEEIRLELNVAGGDNKLLTWLGDRVVAPLRAREVEEDEERAVGALVLVRDSKTKNYRVQGPAIEAVVGQPPWRTTNQPEGDGDEPNGN